MTDAQSPDATEQPAGVITPFIIPAFILNLVGLALFLMSPVLGSWKIEVVLLAMMAIAGLLLCYQFGGDEP